MTHGEQGAHSKLTADQIMYLIAQYYLVENSILTGEESYRVEFLSHTVCLIKDLWLQMDGIAVNGRHLW